MAANILDADAMCLHELANECYHGLLLRLCSGVLALTNEVASANVAYAYALAISARAMRTSNLLWSALLHLSVKGDDVVIATALPSSFSVPTLNIGNGEGLAFSRCRAMDDYFLYFSHD